MSLDQLNTGETEFVVHLEDHLGRLLYYTPNGEAEDASTAVTITVVGVDSKAYKKKRHELTTKQLGAVMSGRKNKAKSALSPDDQIHLTACCVVDWQNVVLGGDLLPCTPENAFMVFKRVELVHEQVQDAIEDRANFISS